MIFFSYKKNNKRFVPLETSQNEELDVKNSVRAHRTHKSLAGFTLIELVVATSLFVAAMVVIVGLFIRVVKTQRMVQSLMGAQSNASLSLEQMMRELRTGFSFSYPQNISPCGTGGAEALTFMRTRENGVPVPVTYFWNKDEERIERKEGSKERTPLTSGDVRVARMCFLNQSFSSPSHPSRITLVMQVGPRDSHVRDRVIDLQTTVSPRTIPDEVVR